MGRNRLCYLAILFLGLTVEGAAKEDGVEPRRCLEDHADEGARLRENDLLTELRESKAGARVLTPKLKIPIIFHVIYTSDDRGVVTRAQMLDQIDVLNEAFAGNYQNGAVDSGISFTLHSVNRILNNVWYDDCKSSSFDFRPQHSQDSSRFVNVFTCSGDGYLGWTWLPWSHSEGSPFQALVMKDDSLVGRAGGKYDQGYTLVHEMGHYFGLLHTFQRGTCTESGDDGVADTPFEADYGSSCGSDYTDYSKNSCPGSTGGNAGNDPIWSFMDYSYDRCMNRFSVGQVDRMLQMIELHRPGLRQNSFNGWAGDTSEGSITTAPTPTPTHDPTPQPSVAPTRAPNMPITATVTLTEFENPIRAGRSFSVTYRIRANNLGNTSLSVNVALYDSNMLWMVGNGYFTFAPGEEVASNSATLRLGKSVVAGTNYVLRVIVLKARHIPESGEYLDDSKILDTTDYTVEVLRATPTACDKLIGQGYWEFKSSVFPTVCASAKDENGVCLPQESFLDAVATCHAKGARLCTAEEMRERVTRNLGCAYNSKYSWTSTQCNGGYVLETGTPGQQPSICVDGSLEQARLHNVYTRCCADDGFVPTGMPTPSPTSGPTTPKPTTLAPVVCENECTVNGCSDTTCKRWKDLGFCKDESLYHFWMNVNCKKECGFCQGDQAANVNAIFDNCTSRIADVKDPCDDTACCSGDTMICSVRRNRGKRWCLVENPEVKLYDNGEACHRHIQCVSKYCDKSGLYGHRYRCAAAIVKSQASDNDGESEASDQADAEARKQAENEETLIVVIISFGGLIVVVALFIVYKHVNSKKQPKQQLYFAPSTFNTSSSISTLSTDMKSSIADHMPLELRQEYSRQARREALRLDNSPAFRNAPQYSNSQTQQAVTGMRRIPAAALASPKTMSSYMDGAFANGNSKEARVINDLKMVHNLARNNNHGDKVRIYNTSDIAQYARDINDTLVSPKRIVAAVHQAKSVVGSGSEASAMEIGSDETNIYPLASTYYNHRK